MPKRKSRPATSPQRAAQREQRARTDVVWDGPPGWMVACALAVFLGAAYLASINAPFIFDDRPSVTENESIVSLWPLVNTAAYGPLNPPPELPVSGRPLVNLTFAVNRYFGGYNPAGYHAFNFLLHFGAAMLLFAITRRTLRLPYFAGRFERSAGWLALAVAMLWSMHPLLTESVVYITQRTELMMGFFYLATLYCCLRYWSAGSQISDASDVRIGGEQADHGGGRSQQSVWLVLAVLACLAGMASKEVMVSAPLIALLFERTFIAGSLAKAVRRSWPLYVGLALTWALTVYLNLDRPHRDAAGFTHDVTAVEWWLTQSKVLLVYLKLVVWPSPLLIHYQMPYLQTIAEAWKYVLPVALLGVATLVLLWKNRPLGFLGAWFFAILSPTFLIPIVTEIAAERRMYLALVVPIVIMVVGGFWLLTTIRRRNAAEPAAPTTRESFVAIGLPAFALAAVFCFINVTRLYSFEDELSLWIEVNQAQPENLMALQFIGSHLESIGNVDAAIAQFRRITQLDPTGKDPTAAQAHYRLGALLLSRGKIDEAVEHMAHNVRVLPENAGMRVNYGYAQFMAGRNDEAIDEYRTAIKLDAQHYAAHKNLGVALQKAGKYKEAIGSLENAMRLQPGSYEVYNDLAKCYRALGDRSQAMAMLERGLERARWAGDTDRVNKFTAEITANE